MRLMLWGLVTPTWEDVAPEVAVPACRKYVPIKKDTLGQVVAQFTMTCYFGFAYTWHGPVALW